MPNLKNSAFLIFFICSSCAAKDTFKITSYHDKKKFEDFHVVKVNSDHVKQECVFLNAEDENQWRHQYAMYILNNQKEVIEVLRSIHQDKSTCLSQTKEISKILKKETVVTLCLRGNLKKITENTEFKAFDKLEKYPVLYSFLNFDSICNSKNCYSVNDVWKNTCPGFKKN